MLDSYLRSPCATMGRPPQAEFFYIYGWLIKIYGYFSAKLENCREGIFRLKTSVVYQIYG